MYVWFVNNTSFGKYYLINKKAVFVDELYPHNDETLVHYKVIPPGFGKFKIKTVSILSISMVEI